MKKPAALPAGVTVLERGWLSANNIVFLGREQSALIDSGYLSHAPQTLALVAHALAGRPLDRLLNTHLHSDHCGGNAALQQRYPALRTAIPPGEAEQVARWDEDALSYRPTGQDCARFRFDELIRPGSEVLLGDACWQAHAAPGHDPHSLIFFEPESRTLISADALWANGFGVVFPELLGEPSFGEVGATLDLIERLAPARIIPGHGPVFDDLAGALTVARQRLDGFARDPARHLRHALKVLLKFKLLAEGRIERGALARWWLQTPYIERVRPRAFAAQSAHALFDDILADLLRAGAASIDGPFVRDAGGR